MKLALANRTNEWLLAREKKIITELNKSNESLAPINKERDSVKTTINILENILEKNSGDWFSSNDQIISPAVFEKIDTKSIHQCVENFNQHIEEKNSRSFLARVGLFLESMIYSDSDSAQQNKFAKKLFGAVQKEIVKNGLTPIDEIFTEPVRNEYGVETYWRLLFSKNIWITPGIRLVFNPALNQEHDFIAIPQVKFRIAL